MGKKSKKKKLKDKEKDRMKDMKEEIACELGLEDDIAKRGWANLTSRETGKIGGYISKKLKEKEKGQESGGSKNQNSEYPAS